jgi:hypothetical protein
MGMIIDAMNKSHDESCFFDQAVQAPYKQSLTDVVFSVSMVAVQVGTSSPWDSHSTAG